MVDTNHYILLHLGEALRGMNTLKRAPKLLEPDGFMGCEFAMVISHAAQLPEFGNENVITHTNCLVVLLL